MDDIFGIVWPLVISVVRIYPHEIILYLELLVAPCGFIKSSTSNTTRSIHWTNQQQISIVIPWNYLSLSIIIYHHDSSMFIISIFFQVICCLDSFYDVISPPSSSESSQSACYFLTPPHLPTPLELVGEWGHFDKLPVDLGP